MRQFVLTARAASAAASDTVTAALAPALGWLPAPVIARVSGQLTSTNDVQVSNVPGVPYPVYIAGSRITHMYPFGPLPGCAAMITLISHNEECCIGINADAAAITDPGRAHRGSPGGPGRRGGAGAVSLLAPRGRHGPGRRRTPAGYGPASGTVLVSTLA